MNTGQARIQKIQVAFQGGGAKLFALLAASDALLELIESGEVEVTNAVGVSAGAIAAVCLAAGIKIDDISSAYRHRPPRLGGFYFPYSLMKVPHLNAQHLRHFFRRILREATGHDDPTLVSRLRNS